MKTITNNIKCLNLKFVNGIANTFINCPFLVNELQVVGLSLSQPIQATNTNSQISYSTATFTGSAIDTYSTFTGYISSYSPINIIGTIVGNVLTVTTTAGLIGIGAILSGTALPLTTIVSYGSGTSGGLGTYNINITQTTSGTFPVYNVGNQLTVQSTPTNTIQIGGTLIGTGIAPNTTITTFLGGTGGIGTYTVSVSQCTIPETINMPVSTNQLLVSSMGGGSNIQI